MDTFTCREVYASITIVTEETATQLLVWPSFQDSQRLSLQEWIHPNSRGSSFPLNHLTNHSGRYFIYWETCLSWLICLIYRRKTPTEQEVMTAVQSIVESVHLKDFLSRENGHFNTNYWSQAIHQGTHQLVIKWQKTSDDCEEGPLLSMTCKSHCLSSTKWCNQKFLRVLSKSKQCLLQSVLHDNGRYLYNCNMFSMYILAWMSWSRKKVWYKNGMFDNTVHMQLFTRTVVIKFAENHCGVAKTTWEVCSEHFFFLGAGVEGRLNVSSALSSSVSCEFRDAMLDTIIG